MHKKTKRSNLKADCDNFRTFRNNVISKVRKRKLDNFDERTGKKKKKNSNQERFGSKDWWKLVKSILRKKGIGPEEIPHCVKTEQLFMQIKKWQRLGEKHIQS